MINKLFPILTHLHILQLEGYSPKRFLKWYTHNVFTRGLEQKIPLVWTQKAKNIIFLAFIYQLATLLFSLYYLKWMWAVLILLILLTQPYFFLIAGILTLIPYEKYNRNVVKNRIKKRILELKKDGLIVIGITGSYGKTTTKEFLYQVLKTKYKVLKTPESYNTLFGINKVVDLELTNYYDFFICEMGAYKIGEIKELCDVVQPDHGILTGIAEQHLERFKSIENTIKAKFELIEAIPSNLSNLQVINIDNKHILENYKTYTSSPITYGRDSKEYSYGAPKYLHGKTNVEFVLKGTSVTLRDLNIAGLGNISNALACAALAKELGFSNEDIKKSIEGLQSVEHRLVIKELKDKTIIDDAYSSNIEGFKVALDLLDSFDGRTKVLVTPGIVELGTKTAEVHEKIGEKANKVCDYAILVGTNERTTNLAKSIDASKVVYIDSISQLSSAIGKLKLNRPVVLIENDLPDNY